MFKYVWLYILCLVLFEDVLGVPEEEFCCLGGILGMAKLLGSLLWVFKGSVHTGLSLAEANPPIWFNIEMLRKFSPDHFEISKYQNSRINAF